jgi:hypothetical protein
MPFSECFSQFISYIQYSSLSNPSSIGDKQKLPGILRVWSKYSLKRIEIAKTKAIAKFKSGALEKSPIAPLKVPKCEI